MWLAETLAKHPRCRLLALVNQRRSGPLQDTAAAVSCILELADVLAVSGDSISMVCEAVATAKPVISFPPKAVTETKYHRFLQQMDERGRLQLVQSERVGQSVIEAVNGSRARRSPSPDADGSIIESLRKWL